MSEFQYYEFLAIDRPLTAEQQAAMRQLSSRVQLSSTSAVFTYSYGNFRGRPLDVLARHFDAMLHLANWGSKQLAFRLPKAAVDLGALQPYSYGVDEIEVRTVGEYVILDIAFREEDGLGWIEDEPGRLAPLASLRDDLLRGDLRMAYLAWLASAQRGGATSRDDGAWGEEDEGYEDDEDTGDDGAEDATEPPVPPGLGQLNAPLQAFIDFFAIDPDLVAAAAQVSPPLKATSEPIEQWVALLPEAERNRFLVRAARGEPVSAELLRRLRAVGGAERPTIGTAPRRPFPAIAEAAKQVERERKVREQREAERARLARLEALAKRAEIVWGQIPVLLAQRNASGYEQAVAHLAELRDLAVHRKERPAFDARMADVVAPYATSPALQRRLKEKGLM